MTNEELKSKKELQVRLYTAVVNVPNDSTDFKLKVSNLKYICQDYACIYHDKDTFVDDDGITKLKTPHYHLVLWLGTKRRFMSVLDNLVKLLGVPSNCVSLSSFDSLTMALGYLTHKYDSDKFQYSDEDVVCSRKEWYDKNITCDLTSKEKIMTEVILASNGDYLYVLNHLGFDTCKDYNTIITAIYKNQGWYRK